MYQINLTLPRIRLVSNIRVYVCIYIYIFFCFDILNCFLFFYVQTFVTGLTVRDSDQIYMRYWDDLSLTQLLVGRIGHPKKDRLAE